MLTRMVFDSLGKGKSKVTGTITTKLLGRITKKTWKTMEGRILGEQRKIG